VNPHSRLGASFLKEHPADAAHVLENFPAESVAAFLADVSTSTTEQVIGHLTPAFAANCLLAIEPAAASRIFARLAPDLQVTLLRTLNRDRREALLTGVNPDMAASIRRLLPYSEGTVGVLMESPLASVPEEFTSHDALKRIKRIRHGTKFYIYVTNAMFQLTGVMTLHELIKASPTSNVTDIMHRHVVSLSPSQSIHNVIESPYWQDFHALPVIDENNVLIGVIRQKKIHRFQELSAQVGAVSGSLGVFMAVGEVFSVTIGHLLAALIATGTSLTQRDHHG
jgi:magnesium transporter